jgi:hypothetical protein
MSSCLKLIQEVSIVGIPDAGAAEFGDGRGERWLDTVGGMMVD